MSTVFIRTPARVMAILQLCVAFSTVLWIVTAPFLGDYVRSKSSALLFQAVMGEQEASGRAQRDWERFQQLSEPRRVYIEKASTDLQKHMSRSFWVKCGESLHDLLFGISPLTQIWLILSISLPIMLLRRSERALPAVWLIPAVALAFAVDNQRNGALVDPREVALFPTEEQLPLGTDLPDAWQRYLVQQWAGETPEDRPERFIAQLEKGEHAFRATWLETQLQAKPLGHRARRSPFMLALVILWNLLFAIVTWKTLRPYQHYADHPS